MLRTEAKKTEEMIKQSKPIMTQKVEVLIMKQLNLLMESTNSSFEMIEGIGGTLKNIHDQNSPTSRRDLAPF
jgi:hypothetical protein